MLFFLIFIVVPKNVPLKNVISKQRSNMIESNESVILEQSAQIELKYLTISAKGKFKWSGNLQARATRIDQSTTWTTNKMIYTGR
jgi:L-lactate utilization protein LutB